MAYDIDNLYKAAVALAGSDVSSESAAINLDTESVPSPTRKRRVVRRK